MRSQSVAALLVASSLWGSGCELVTRANCDIYSTRMEAEGFAFRLDTPEQRIEVRFSHEKTDGMIGIIDGPNFPQFDRLEEAEDDFVFYTCLSPFAVEGRPVDRGGLELTLLADGEPHSAARAEPGYTCSMSAWPEGYHLRPQTPAVNGKISVDDNVIEPTTLEYQLIDKNPPTFRLNLQGPSESGDIWRLELEAKTSIHGNAVTCDS